MTILVRVLLKKISLFAACLSVCFFQAVIFVFDGMAQSQVAAPQATGPIDIQANEQDFNEDQVIARGNVRVKYKDSTILAPQATLFRDAAGQPQKAIFIGHPDLVQGGSKMNADTLIFEIVNSKIIAQGHAHSEVTTSGDTDTEIAPKAAPKKGANGKQPFKWPKQGEEEANTAALESGAMSNVTSTADSGNQSVTATVGAIKKKGITATVEKIITDSETQEYNKQAGHFDADGHVHVIHGEMSVFADKLQLVYGTDGKPETAHFTGHVNAYQGKNNTQSDLMTYYLSTKRLQATGNVRSKVIQEKPPLDPKKDVKKIGDGNNDGTDKKIIGQAPQANSGAANAAPRASSLPDGKGNDDDSFIIVSDSQDYSKDSGRMSADGNVKVYYQDTVGYGPKAIMIRNAQGNAEKVIFNGRSQITQPGKRWIADKITFLVPNKKVLAEGNTRAFIMQAQPADTSHGSSGVASKANSLSTSKVEATR